MIDNGSIGDDYTSGDLASITNWCFHTLRVADDENEKALSKGSAVGQKQLLNQSAGYGCCPCNRSASFFNMNKFQNHIVREYSRNASNNAPLC